MANVKITELPVATVVNDADSLVIVQAGVTKQAPNSLVSSGLENESAGTGGLNISDGTSGANGSNYCVSLGKNSEVSLNSVAIGYDAGSLAAYNHVSIGYQAGDRHEGYGNVNIGYQSNYWVNTNTYSTNVGYQAGSVIPGTGAVNLGAHTGANSGGDYSVSIGYKANSLSQLDNTIMIKADGIAARETTEAGEVWIGTTASSLAYTAAGGWDFASGNVNAVSFTGDGSGLTGVGGATKFYTNLPYMGDDGAQVLLDDDFAIGSDDFYLEIRFLLGSVNGEGKIFALGGTTDATGPNGAFYATKGSFGGVNVYASPTGTVANKFTMLGNAAESPGIYNSIILARSGTNVALYYNGVREYFGNPNEITTLTSGALSLWGLCDGTGGAAGAADGQTSGFLFNKGSSVIDITQTTTATTLGVASSQFSEVAYGSDITLQSALPYLAIGDALESALKFGTEQVGYTYSGSFALKGNPSASVSGEQLATRLYNYGSSINLVAPNDAYIGTRYGAISINYPKTRHDQSAGGSHEFRVNDVVRATINGTDATFVDTVNATAFVGDGSGLTNLPAGGASSLQAVTTVGSTTTDSISIGGLTINNQYIMPTANGATGYYLTSNSNGSVTWTAPPGSTTPNLQAVTTAGATTSSIITVAGLNSARSGAGTNAFSAGLNAGLTSQGNYTVAIGDAAGKTSQGQWAVAIGYRAGEGTQGMDGVGIGNNAGNTLQGNFAVAVGGASGSTNQGNSAVALGRRAGQTSQGANAIAIGDEAGKTNQAANSIVMNATSAAVENTTANTFVVKPVRDVAGTIPAGFKQVAYNPTTGEFISYG